MHKKILLLLAVIVMAGCSQPSGKSAATETQSETQPETQTETQRLNAWFEDRYEEELQFSPIQLTFMGRKDLYDQIDDMSLEAAHKRLVWQKKTVAELKKSFDYDALTADGKISYDTWIYGYQQAKAGEPFEEHSYLFNQMSGAHSFLPTFLINFHRVDSQSDMDAYITRISGIARAYDQLTERAKKAAAKGIRPPAFAYEKVLDELNKLLTGAPFTPSDEDAPLWADAQAKVDALMDTGTVDKATGDKLKASAKQALLDTFAPAAKRIAAFVKADLPNSGSQSFGVSALPDGKAYYNYRLQEMTTTDMTADEIHALGLKEVDRLRAEMVALKDKSGFKGDLQAFFAMLRDSKDDPRFYYPDTDAGRRAYLDDATAAIDNIKHELPKYFGILPKADLVVKRVEAFREQDGAAQHYYPGAPDGTRPGIYYAHLSDMTAMPKNQLEVIAYHEGIPGHHMQISIAQEQKGIPTFRQQAQYTAYVEGWALYSEYLASEMPNTYQDVYSDFGRVTTEIWRAIRLVVDTGLHAKGWTEQQAVDYFANNSPEPLDSIRSEVQRYLVLPGQATSYKIGMLDILRLRAEAQQKLGTKFDIRGFHDAVLGGGALPLTLLDQQVNNWVSAQL